MAGRRPLPAPLKVLRGDPGKRLTIAKKEAARKRPESGPESRGVAPPEWLSERERAAWPMIEAALVARLGALGPQDQVAIEQLVTIYADWLDARARLQEKGRTYECETASGAVMHRAHPAVAQEADAWRRLRLMLSEFGLTPATAGKVGGGGGSEDDFDKLLKSHPRR